MDDNDKPISADYKKVSFKVPKKDCDILFDSYSQYSVFEINPKNGEKHTLQEIWTRMDMLQSIFLETAKLVKELSERGE